MSIIRLSLLRDGLYAPDHRGVIGDPRPYSMARGRDRRGAGLMGLYARPARPGASDPLVRYLGRSLEIEAAALPEDAPITVLVNGFQFDPATAFFSPPHHHKADNPHVRIYHFEQYPEEVEMRHHSTGWPRGLGFADGDGGADGLAIGFGWYSNPGFFSSLFAHGKNFYALAYEFAEVAAWHLACVIDVLARLMPGRRIDIFCHSLGSRVVVRSLAQCGDCPDNSHDPVLPGVVEAVDRVLVLAGAEKVLEAQLMMSRLNRARASNTLSRIPDFYNFVSRENDVLDKLGENFGPASPGSKQVIGHNGLESLDPSWTDLQLDHPDVIEWFRQRGYSISGDNTSSVFAVLDHWIHYTWRGNMRVYREILRQRDDWRIADLKAHTGIFDTVRLNRGPRLAS